MPDARDGSGFWANGDQGEEEEKEQADEKGSEQAQIHCAQGYGGQGEEFGRGHEHRGTASRARMSNPVVLYVHNPHSRKTGTSSSCTADEMCVNIVPTIVIQQSQRPATVGLYGEIKQASFVQRMPLVKKLKASSCVVAQKLQEFRHDI